MLLAGEAGTGKTALAEAAAYAGLTASEVSQLLNEVCGERPPIALAAVVHERTGGNPFFVQQNARLLAAQGIPLGHASVTGVPRAVGDVLARRLARLPGGVRFSHESAPLWQNDDGLPIGAHFLGRFGDEATLFRLAAQLEEAQPWVGRRPAVHAANVSDSRLRRRS